MHPSPRDAATRVLTTAAVTGAALMLSAAAALPALGDQPSDRGNGSTSDPAGNNGTVFIHQAARDSHPHNQPHVTCSFYVSFFGFDNGQSLSVSFAGQAPTGKGKALAVNDGTPTTLSSTTPAGGAGNDYDGDLGPFTADNLAVADTLGAPAHEGYHIKLTVSTGQGGGHKYKVFWLQPCPAAPGAVQPATGVQGNGQTVNNGATQSGGTQSNGTQSNGTQSGALVEGAALSAPQNATAPAGAQTGASVQGVQVLGEHMTRGTVPTQVLGESQSRGSSSGALPFTGTEIGLMSAAGVATLAGGTVLMVAVRRRRRALPVR